jgi:hypothetical protein
MGIPGGVLAEFAVAARRAGGPPWPMAGAAERSTPRRQSRDDLVIVRPTRDAARLLWLLRAAFGVNARADLVANLLARPGSSLTVLELAHLTRFTKRNAAVALEDLVLSGVVERLGPGAVVPPPRSRRLPARRSIHRYPDGFATRSDWPFRLPSPTWGPARGHRGARGRARSVQIERAGLPGPDLRATGPAFAGAFDAWVDQLAGRLEAGR